MLLPDVVSCRIGTIIGWPISTNNEVRSGSNDHLTAQLECSSFCKIGEEPKDSDSPRDEGFRGNQRPGSLVVSIRKREVSMS